jgi:hypothetical protein
MLYPLIEGRNTGWPLWMYTAIILSIILIFPFILFERRLSKSEHNDINKGKRSESVSKLPLMPLSLFKDRGFIIGTSIVLVFFIFLPWKGLASRKIAKICEAEILHVTGRTNPIRETVQQCM